MNRRDFITTTTTFVSGVALATTTPLLKGPFTPPTGPAKPQPARLGHAPSADDLAADYKAWVQGDLDAHDIAVLAAKDREFGSGNHSNYVCAYGKCDCKASEKAQVRAQLERELVFAKARAFTHTERVTSLETALGRWV